MTSTKSPTGISGTAKPMNGSNHGSGTPFILTLHGTNATPLVLESRNWTFVAGTVPKLKISTS